MFTLPNSNALLSDIQALVAISAVMISGGGG